MTTLTMKQVEAVTLYLEQDRELHMQAPHHFWKNDAGKMAAALESAGVVIDFGSNPEIQGPPFKRYLVNCVYMTQEEIPVKAIDEKEARLKAGSFFLNLCLEAEETTSVQEVSDGSEWQQAKTNFKKLQATDI